MNEIAIPKIWTNNSYKQFIIDLRKLKDEKYLEFNKKIIFTNYEMIGIRVPILRKISKQIKNTSIDDFLKIIDPKTFEEIFIYGTILSYIKNYDTFIKEFTKYLTYIDNWAICDMVLSNLKIINKNQEKFEHELKNYLKNSNEFIVRVGVISLMYHYLNKEKLQDIFNYLERIDHNGYYVKMAIAWTISIIYIKYKEEALYFLTKNNLKKEIVNMTIQKIRDSKRVTKEEKEDILKYKK